MLPDALYLVFRNRPDEDYFWEHDLKISVIAYEHLEFFPEYILILSVIVLLFVTYTRFMKYANPKLGGRCPLLASGHSGRTSMATSTQSDKEND